MVQGMDARTIRAWALVIGWAVLVWGFGGDGFSQQQTSSFLGPLIRWLFPDISYSEIYQVQLFVRKSAHVFEYGLLAILTLRAILLGRPASLAMSAGLTMAIIVTFATADETRQGFSSDRAGSVWDALLDSAAAVVAIGILLFLRRRFGLGSDDLVAPPLADRVAEEEI
ncbi:MAG: VanZ family protein [Deltaproteobacteria bacterium]|nr:VanZ family protein [Deltaproteobacteria bacterium]